MSGGAALRTTPRVVVWLRTHICCAASRFFHNLQLQPVVVLSLRSDRLVHRRRVYFRLNNATDSCMSTDFGLDRALAVNLSDGCVSSGWLVRKHHLIRVRRELASCALMQVACHLVLAVASIGVCAEVHVVAHLNRGFSHVGWHINHLRHKVLMSQLDLLFGLLMLACCRVKRRHLQSVRNILVARSSERGWCALLGENLAGLLLLGLVVLNHHGLSSAVIFHTTAAWSYNSWIVVLVSLVLHEMNQLVLS